MSESEITATILREIRDELRATKTELKAEFKAEIHGLSSKLDTGLAGLRTELRTGLETTNARLDVVEHTVADAAAQIVFLARYVKNHHEAAIEDLRARVTRLELESPD